MKGSLCLRSLYRLLAVALAHPGDHVSRNCIELRGDYEKAEARCEDLFCNLLATRCSGS
jgi:hypothetical protein